MSKRQQKPDNKQLFHNLAKDLHDLVNNKQALRTSVEHFLDNLIDELSLGIVFDIHRKCKTGAFDLEADDRGGEDDEDSGGSDLDAFTHPRRVQECTCSHCNKVVPALQFAKHLNSCMGIITHSRASKLRNASRKTANSSSSSSSRERGDSGSLSDVPSDNEDDEDWSEPKPSKKKGKACKPKRGTPKKTIDPLPMDTTLNVDVEGNDDELTNLKDILHLQDHPHSNSTSPADSVSSSGSSGTGKRRDTKGSKKKGESSRGSARSSPITME